MCVCVCVCVCVCACLGMCESQQYLNISSYCCVLDDRVSISRSPSRMCPLSSAHVVLRYLVFAVPTTYIYIYIYICSHCVHYSVCIEHPGSISHLIANARVGFFASFPCYYVASRYPTVNFRGGSCPPKVRACVCVCVCVCVCACMCVGACLVLEAWWMW